MCFLTLINKRNILRWSKQRKKPYLTYTHTFKSRKEISWMQPMRIESNRNVSIIKMNLHSIPKWDEIFENIPKENYDAVWMSKLNACRRQDEKKRREEETLLLESNHYFRNILKMKSLALSLSRFHFIVTIVWGCFLLLLYHNIDACVLFLYTRWTCWWQKWCWWSV